jgi:hypothetical protein
MLRVTDGGPTANTYSHAAIVAFLACLFFRSIVWRPRRLRRTPTIQSHWPMTSNEDLRARRYRTMSMDISTYSPLLVQFILVTIKDSLFLGLSVRPNSPRLQFSNSTMEDLHLRMKWDTRRFCTAMIQNGTYS